MIVTSAKVASRLYKKILKTVVTSALAIFVIGVVICKIGVERTLVYACTHRRRSHYQVPDLRSGPIVARTALAYHAAWF